MGNNFLRMLSTGLVWAAVAGMGITAMVSTNVNVEGGAFVLMIAILMIGGAAATSTIWKYGDHGDDTSEAEKAKRRSRVDRMIDRMDERDLAELRARLAENNDGEMMSLDELMQEKERQR